MSERAEAIKRKVLSKWPGAYAFYGKSSGVEQYRVYMPPYWNGTGVSLFIIGEGLTEELAWIDVEKRLGPEIEFTSERINFERFFNREWCSSEKDDR